MSKPNPKAPVQVSRTSTYCVAIVAALIVLAPPRATHAFDTFEHWFIGQAAYDRARKKVDKQYKGKACQVDKQLDTWFPPEKPGDCTASESSPGISTPPADRSPLQGIPVGFGDLSAISGDFVVGVDHDKGFRVLDRHVLSYRSLDQVFASLQGLQAGGEGEEDTDLVLAVRDHLVRTCIWLKGPISQTACTQTIVDELNGTRDETPGPLTRYEPRRPESASFENLPAYANLAAENVDHFPKHSWGVYRQHHKRALKAAKKYASNHEEGAGALRIAILEEGFAQHFLQDSFASGHIGSRWGACYGVPAIHMVPSCFPSREILLHTHDTLNELGLRVKSRPSSTWDAAVKACSTSQAGSKANSTDSADASPGPQYGVSWSAFGDDSLFVGPACVHRQLVIGAATQSLQEVLAAAIGPGSPDAPSDFDFPVPDNPRMSFSDPEFEEKSYAAVGHFSIGECGSDLSKWNDDFVPADTRVPPAPVEGLKLLVTAGWAFGDYSTLNANGSVMNDYNSHSAMTFEVGYVRPAFFGINYLGVGALIVPSRQTSLYPLSLGHWFTRVWWGQRVSFGPRVNLGIRIDDALQGQNTESRSHSNVTASFTWDTAVEIFPPLAVYLRTDVVSTTHVEDGGNKGFNTDSLFTGTPVVTLGARLDLAGILGN